MKLYHYVHCPFCLRVRMVLGFLNQSYESVVLPYDDEKTPIDLKGVKMLPILSDQSFVSNESLDIIKYIDKDNILNTSESINNYSELEPLLNKLGSDIHSLAMPYFIWTPEFNEASRNYFQTKKEKKRGPFKDLVKNRQKFLDGLESTLDQNKEFFSKDITKENINLNDILLASHLWGMYIVPEFQFNPDIHNYLQKIASVCNFEYHEEYWR